MKFLEAFHIKVPKVIFYDEQVIDNNNCAILATEALLGFKPLDVLTQYWQTTDPLTRQQKKRLLATIASTLRCFHQTGLTHRALYPKHIFVKNEDSYPEIALIDLEKARFSPFFLYRVYFDLSALNRHAEYWTRSERLFFFLQYFQAKRFNKLLRLICQFILRRSTR